MKATLYAALLALVLGVGCGGNQTAKETPKENPSKGDDKNSTKAKPVKELTLREKVVGTYEDIEDEETYRIVLLENGGAEDWRNGKRISVEKWKIVDGKIHIFSKSEDNTSVLRINLVGPLDGHNSITDIGYIDKTGRMISVDGNTFTEIN